MPGHGEMITHGEMIARIAAGAVLGGVIGYERDRHRRPVGLRTHLIVAMTAATFMVISSQFVYWQHYGKDDFVEVDASRIAASVVSGIGFLAGGSILRSGATVQGLTTAAALWLVTAIGMCAGSGMYVEAVIVTGFGIVALTVLRRFEDKNDQLVSRHVSLVLGGIEVIEGVMTTLRQLGVVVEDFDYDHRLEDDKKRVEVTFDMSVPVSLGVPKVIVAIEGVPGVRRLQVARAR
jgi:putative Mg2+ transporter-C (MgtC) family protein